MFKTALDCLASTTRDCGTDMRTMLRGVDLIEDEEPWVTWDRDQAVKKQVALTDDPIAMSCASYRLWKESGARWLELEQMKPTADDRVQANDIRSYYRGRLTWSALKGQNTVSQFRKKLHALVTGNLDITKDELGILYRLPYFYAEDTAVDEVIAVTDDSNMVSKIHGLTTPLEITTQFRLLRQVLYSRRACEYHHYWLASDFDSAPFMIAVDTKNNMASLLESVLARPTQLTALLYPKPHRGYHRNCGFWSITRLRLSQ